MKNKKLIKRIAVASLACFLAIPTINTVPTQAETLVTVEMLQQEIEQEKKKIEDAKKNLEICKGLKSEKEQYNKTNNTTSGWENAIENYEIAIKDKQANINDIRNGVVMYRYTKEENEQKKKENQEKLVQQAAQKAAEQAEKDRIANTIYQIPAGVDNVYDFVPHFDGNDKTHTEEHKYERADMPGVIFTLRCGLISSTGKYGITDLDPHFTISDFRNYRIKCKAYDGAIVHCYFYDCKVNYVSPFNAYIPSISGLGTILQEPDTGFELHPGENVFDIWCMYGTTEENDDRSQSQNTELEKIMNLKTADDLYNYVKYTRYYHPTVAFGKKSIKSVKGESIYSKKPDERITALAPITYFN